MRIWLDSRRSGERSVTDAKSTNDSIVAVLARSQSDAAESCPEQGRDQREDAVIEPSISDLRTEPGRKKKFRDKITVGRNGSFSRFFGNKPDSTFMGDQMKVVYRQFGPEAEDLLFIERQDGVPSPEARDNVVVNVQVRKLPVCRVDLH